MNIITITKKIGAYRCCVCGRFIADSQLGVSAHKENPDRCMSEFAHDDCLAKRASKIIDYINATKEEK